MVHRVRLASIAGGAVRPVDLLRKSNPIGPEWVHRLQLVAGPIAGPPAPGTVSFPDAVGPTGYPIIRGTRTSAPESWGAYFGAEYNGPEVNWGTHAIISFWVRSNRNNLTFQAQIVKNDASKWIATPQDIQVNQQWQKFTVNVSATQSKWNPTDDFLVRLNIAQGGDSNTGLILGDWLEMSDVRMGVFTQQFTEDFSTLTTANLWTKFPVNYGGVTVVNGKLRIPVTSAYPSARTADGILSLQETPLSVELVTPSAANTASGFNFTLMATGDTNNYVSLGASGSPRTLSTNMVANGVASDQYHGDYTPGVHNFLRFRITGSTLVFEVTDTPGGVWTVLRTAVAPAWMMGGNKVSYALNAGNWANSQPVGDYTEWRNVNILP